MSVGCWFVTRSIAFCRPTCLNSCKISSWTAGPQPVLIFVRAQIIGFLLRTLTHIAAHCVSLNIMPTNTQPCHNRKDLTGARRHCQHTRLCSLTLSATRHTNLEMRGRQTMRNTLCLLFGNICTLLSSVTLRGFYILHRLKLHGLKWLFMLFSVWGCLLTYCLRCC